MAMNQTIGTVGLPSASGYPVLSGLISPVYSASFIERLYAESICGMITSTDIVPTELRSGGDLAIMRRAPRGNIRRLTKNQELEFDTMNTENVTFKVDKAWYWNLKVDKIDFKQIKEIGKWIKLFQDDSIQQLSEQIDHDVLQDMVEAAHMCNKGNAAGVKYHRTKLGQVGAPLVMASGTAVNPLTVLGAGMQVLDEQNAPKRGRFAVFPSLSSMLFLNTPVLAQAYLSGQSSSTLLTGSVMKNMQGADIMFCSHTPTYKDPTTGNPTYPIVFGVKEATGYVNQMTESEQQTSERHFGMFWRGMNIAGWGVIRPELLAVAYVEITTVF
jgi:hypothetical protein